jgi:uncharacterized protein (DUF433 family)
LKNAAISAIGAPPHLGNLAETLSRAYRPPMSHGHIITLEPNKRGGKPCIRGMRVTVHDMLEHPASGMTGDEILTDFSELTRADIKACPAFAA